MQQAGYETALIGKWHLESLPTGFNYWEIVPGQGDYYNPDFITQDNDTIQKHGYVTNLITDDAIDWMENQRDKNKPFCILIHHKAIHRNWLADTCNLALYEDKTFPCRITSLMIMKGVRRCGTGDEHCERYGYDLRPQDAAPGQRNPVEISL